VPDVVILDVTKLFAAVSLTMPAGCLTQSRGSKRKSESHFQIKITFRSSDQVNRQSNQTYRMHWCFEMFDTADEKSIYSFESCRLGLPIPYGLPADKAEIYEEQLTVGKHYHQ
jgi:hypothetical protein